MQVDPRSISHPGEILGEYIDVYRSSEEALAMRVGTTADRIHEICTGEASVTAELAAAFEKVFGRPAHFWEKLQSQFDEAQARLFAAALDGTIPAMTSTEIITDEEAPNEIVFTNYVFPRTWGAWQDERQVIRRPVGLVCSWCDEAIGEKDWGVAQQVLSVNPYYCVHHRECLHRQLIGSVGHQQRACSCYGGTLEDPPGMTAREAARAAVKYTLQNRHTLRDFTIGTEFRIAGDPTKWRVTDIGSRTLIAIKLDHDPSERWDAGPPYAVVEEVFDEYDLAGLEIVPA